MHITGNCWNYSVPQSSAGQGKPLTFLLTVGERHETVVLIDSAGGGDPLGAGSPQAAAQTNCGR
jgi:hypothetical protein